MPVTILNRPYQGLSKNLLPVYNGLGFTLDSSLKTRSNFRYICEIYIDNNKVSELRHHPDISHDNKGVFEVGRVIENFIGYDIFLQSNATTYSGAKTNRRYYVSFGEEYSSANPVSNIAAYDASNFRLNVLTAAFKSWYVGSLVLIGGSNVNAYNGWGKIVGQGASYAIINGLGPKTIDPYYPNLYYYQAFSSNGLTGNPWSYKNINGTNFLTLKIYNGNLAGQSGLDRVFLYIGNTVLIKQTSAGTTQVGQQYYENTEFKITDKSIVSFGGQSCVMLTFDAPYAGVMPVGIIGNVVTKDNVVLKGQANTSADLSYAFNGALQYQEYLDWTPAPYIWSSNTTKFLSNRPDSLKNINVCSDEHWTLSTFGSAQASNLYKVQTETWSTTAAYIFTGAITAGTIPGLGATQYQRILITTTQANNYLVGDYAEITNLSGTIYGQVAYKLVSGGNTFIYLNVASTLSFTSGTITRKIAVKYWNAPVQTASTIQACGPKNYIQAGTYPEFTNSSCYKYFVRVVTSSTVTPWNTYSVQKSETYTFNITCDCASKTKYKLMWLNPLGGWDFYTFDLGSNKSLKIEKTIYQKKLKEVKSAQSNKYTYSQGNRGRTTYDTKSTLNYIVRSNFLTQEKIDWLSWIYESSEVYWIDETNNKLHPITLTATDISIPNKENAGDAGHLYIYTIEFETSYDRTIQRGGDVEYTEQQINTYGVGNDPFGFGYNNQTFY